MPIYAYRCADCGHTRDVLQKLSDPPLTECPACRSAAFTKQVTAAGFQLKGSGWYATDFRNSGSGAPKPAGDGKDVQPAQSESVSDKSSTGKDGPPAKTESVSAKSSSPDTPAPAAGAASGGASASP